MFHVSKKWLSLSQGTSKFTDFHWFEDLEEAKYVTNSSEVPDWSTAELYSTVRKAGPRMRIKVLQVPPTTRCATEDPGTGIQHTASGWSPAQFTQADRGLGDVAKGLERNPPGSACRSDRGIPRA